MIVHRESTRNIHRRIRSTSTFYVPTVRGFESRGGTADRSVSSTHRTSVAKISISEALHGSLKKSICVSHTVLSKLQQ